MLLQKVSINVRKIGGEGCEGSIILLDRVVLGCSIHSMVLLASLPAALFFISGPVLTDPSEPPALPFGSSTSLRRYK